MKFTKVIATALANKTYQKLLANRNERIKNFSLGEKQEKEIKALIKQFIETREAFNELHTQLKAISKNASYYQSDSAKDIFEKCKSQIARLSAPQIPSCDTLIDDFLIESLEAENADELIAKVTAKYAN